MAKMKIQVHIFQLSSNVYRFPLFAKGSEKALFQYAVFLLNKDIAQVYTALVCKSREPLHSMAPYAGEAALWIWNLEDIVQTNSTKPQVPVGQTD